MLPPPLSIGPTMQGLGTPGAPDPVNRRGSSTLQVKYYVFITNSVSKEKFQY